MENGHSKSNATSVANSDALDNRARPALEIAEKVGSLLMAIETGGPGADALNGTAGADTLTGAGGNDNYTVNDPGDLVVELPGEGVDRVEVSINNYVLPDNVEDLLSNVTSYIYNYYGNSLGNHMSVEKGVLYGYGGDDHLTGQGTFYGGDGADTLQLFAGDDGWTARFYGGEGNDEFKILSMKFTTSVNIIFNGDAGADDFSCDLRLNDFDNIKLYGGADSDHFKPTGFILSNATVTIDGGSGADAIDLSFLSLIGVNNTISITGGSGDDTYTVARAWTLTELSGGGHDTVNSSVTFSLGAEFEDLVLTGASAIDGAGNGLANAIAGNSAANILTGGGGADMLSGGGGNDRFRASGADLVSGEGIDGGADFDTLEITGGGAVSLAGITLTGIEAIELANAGGTTLTLASSAQSTLVTAAAGAADTLVMGAWEADFAEIDRLIAAGVETVQFTDGPGRRPPAGPGWPRPSRAAATRSCLPIPARREAGPA
ncbi:MAG: calcium-binding protein [Phyllobacteriaceae bacterium]|nr:calcium-binding protein [Phyllobacteriaceae bacterium]